MVPAIMYPMLLQFFELPLCTIYYYPEFNIAQEMKKSKSVKISKRKNNLIYKENWLGPEKSDKQPLIRAKSIMDFRRGCFQLLLGKKWQFIPIAKLK